MTRPTLPATVLLPRWLRVLGLGCVLVLALPIIGLFSDVPWRSLGESLTSPSALIALRLSLITSAVATLLSVLVGLPAALVMARVPADSALLRAARTLVLLPLVLPPVVGGVALLSTYGRRGLLGPLTDVLGLDIAFTTLAVVLAQTFVAAPFLILTVESALRARGTAYEAAAATLGASPTRTLVAVTLPLLAPNLAAGLVLTFARALGEFGATITFAGSLQGTTRTLPLEIYLAREIDQDAAVAMSLLLVVVAAIVVALAYRAPGAEGLRRTLRRRSPSGVPPGPETEGTVHVAAAPADAPSAPAVDARIVVADRGVDISLQVPAGQTLAIVGPNGSGKSTVLDALAGLVPLDAGHIRLGDRLLAGDDQRTPVPPHRRGITRLGQEPLLFPHLTLLDNVAFGLRAAGSARTAAREQAWSWLDRVGAGKLAARRPGEISGGQAQRAAVARALAARPGLTLWDEPFAALDVDAAPRLRELLADHLEGRTAVLVTHDAADVRALADRVLVLDRGRVVRDTNAAEHLRGRPGESEAPEASGTGDVGEGGEGGDGGSPA